MHLTHLIRDAYAFDTFNPVMLMLVTPLIRDAYAFDTFNPYPANVEYRVSS
jgi:hypothetical protein